MEMNFYLKNFEDQIFMLKRLFWRNWVSLKEAKYYCTHVSES